MAKPGFLCRLKKGEIIDAQQGFVDTFNWLVDFCSNLKGDGDRNAKRHITLDRSVDDHPVIKFSGAVEGSAGVAADQIVVCSAEWTGQSGGSDGEHPYCFEITRGRLAVGDAASGSEGLLVIVPDPQLTQYISTTPHSTELAS